MDGLITKRFFALGNKYRIKIYNLCLKKQLNLTQLSSEVGISYKSILYNVKILEDAELIKKVKEKTEKSQETFIESIKLDGTIYYPFIKEYMEENKIK